MYRMFISGMLFSLLFFTNVYADAVYIWDFTTRNREKNEITLSFTEDFETAIIEKGCYKVLGRRKFDQYISQKEKEKAIMEIENISDYTLKNLKTKEADVVIFGEVYDDINGGEIKITVTFQSFDSSILDSKYVTLPRGLLYDPKSRGEAMKTLTNKICVKKTGQIGLKGEYYNVPPFSGNPKIPTGEPTFVRIDPTIDFDWGEGSPAPKISADFFYIRWIGEIYIETTGTHVFCISGHHGRPACAPCRIPKVGGKLLVNNDTVINIWNKEETTSDRCKPTFLEGGKWYPIRMEIFDQEGDASPILMWQPPGENESSVIPSKNLRTM